MCENLYQCLKAVKSCVCIHEGRLRTTLTIESILLSHDTRKPVFGFPTRPDTNRAVWPKEMARGSDSGSSGSLLSVYAVQPCGYETLFCICKKPIFS